jgi:hypothetical protein
VQTNIQQGFPCKGILSEVFRANEYSAKFSVQRIIEQSFPCKGILSKVFRANEYSGKFFRANEY